ncbi:MAG: c-type cytochrome biogenesis protein CcsB [Deltaproteobacteria bacterium]|nr:c-type cytochrome biogenesis protein CcsB [Deltaproteobacteria bacterium]
MHNSSLILSTVTFIYALSACFYVGFLIFKKEMSGKIGFAFLITGFIGNTAGIILRWVESYRLGIGHAPLSNLYESLVFFSWTCAALYIFIEKKYKNRSIGAFVMPCVFFAIAYASLSPNISDKINPLVPALKSNWLIAHVLVCFLGYAAFTIAFGVSLMYLLRNSEGVLKNKKIFNFLPNNDTLDDLVYRTVMFGFLFLTTGIITGAVWANSAWGTYWSFDPKETWSLITWFIYAVLLHLRFMSGWRGKKIAWVSIIGFTAVLFTYFGVNYLPGLHSYAN